MEALKKQASKLREHIAKQQQAVLKQFSARYNQDPSLVDEAELEYHQNLQRLYSTTRAAKHFQRNIVRGVEGFIAVSTKQMEIVKKLAEDCCKYGNDNQHFGFVLARASVEFGKSHSQIEEERENLLKVLGEEVFEPLREMIMSAPLEDARLLTYRYQRIRQDMESQIADVMRKQLKSKESNGNKDSSVKLQHAESKLSELRTTLAALGREATAAMEAVEAQQQQVTFDRLLAMVDAERAYHQNAADILNKLHDEVATNGWSEGECKGKAGWFPSAYVELRDKAPASKAASYGGPPLMCGLRSTPVGQLDRRLRHPIRKACPDSLGESPCRE
ncbi:SH3 domain-containing protein 2-like isoform X3 [Phragmites australis]|uniref:SH3 domain-containing protein 2-like isoform X3 n=1 Tax=Phragmites australis TaxID=29695 RepID=UPI002D7699D9|nr:SH3 domain-containing protein 2-like isoform X3 [Phragmites australis]